MLHVQRSPCFDDYFSLVSNPRQPQLKVTTGQLRLSHLDFSSQICQIIFRDFQNKTMAGRNPLKDKLEDEELDLSMMQLTDVPVRVGLEDEED